MPQTGVSIDFFKVLLGFMTLLGIVAIFKKVFTGFKASSDYLPTLWAKKKSFRVFKGINILRYEDRFDANPGKTFFGARDAIEANEQIFFAEGIVAKRHVWVYRITGKPPHGSGLGTVRNRQVTPQHEQLINVLSYDPRETVSERVFYGWCVEIGTKHIPQTVTVTKKFINKDDVLHVESLAFEKVYNISNTNDSMVLQLLDPVLIELIQQSKCSAIEISDASVVLYFTLSEIGLEALDAMLQNGLQIAEQVDRNFPLGK